MSEQGWREFLAADGVEGSGALLTIVDASLTVRLTRGPLQLESRHVDLARAVQEVQFAIASKPDAVDVGFWRAVLGYAPLGDDAGVDPLGHGSTVWMQELDDAKPLRHAMHVDVSVARDHVEGRLAAALAAGGTPATRRQMRATSSSAAGPNAGRSRRAWSSNNSTAS